MFLLTSFHTGVCLQLLRTVGIHQGSLGGQGMAMPLCVDSQWPRNGHALSWLKLQCWRAGPLPEGDASDLLRLWGGL